MRCVLLAILAGMTLLTCTPDDRDSFDRHIAADAMVIDVRTAEEFALGHYPGAINIPHEQIVAGLAARSVPLDTPLALYCRSGNRSGRAVEALRTAGFSTLQNAGDLKTLLEIQHRTMTVPAEATR